MRHLLSRIAFLSLLLCAGAVPAQEPLPQMPLDCWISTERTYSVIEQIRCIKDRSGGRAADDAVDSVEDIALDRIHRLLHERNFDELDRFVLANLATLGKGDLWTIRIFSYPAPWSWAEERPQRLVRAAICPAGFACPVSFPRDLPPAEAAGAPARPPRRRPANLVRGFGSE